jgi:hypothetical protein
LALLGQAFEIYAVAGSPKAGMVQKRIEQEEVL